MNGVVASPRQRGKLDVTRSTRPRMLEVQRALRATATTPSGSKESLDIAIVSFSGARASTDDDLKTYSGTPAKTSKAEAAGYLKKLPSGGPSKRK